jgi:signal transduction histidine kinase
VDPFPFAFSLRIKVKAPALGECAAQLPWLAPSAAALVALARSPAAPAWEAIRHDPGAVLLVVRHSAAMRSLPSLSLFPALLEEPAILEAAVHYLNQPATGWVDWSRPGLQPLFQASITLAQCARELAQQSPRCDPDNAWVAGLLAPLGWFAVAAVEEEAVGCLADPLSHEQPTVVQQRAWGLDQGAIARRLSRRWGLPGWLAGVVGHLDLPVELAQMLGAEPELFQLVQAAVVRARRRGMVLPLVGTHLVTDPDQAEAAGEAASAAPAAGSPTENYLWQPPQSVPLLRDLLQVAAEKRRLQQAPARTPLEEDLDRLHAALCEQKATETKRLRELKLMALAELAAGAGHEINNPLAVISGQAQYLLSHDSEPTRQRSLQTIVGQTQRIHQVLSDLMQFARPARPQKQLVHVPTMVEEVATTLRDLAAQRKIQLRLPSPQAGADAFADPRQVRTALTCLLRNAIEAALPEGWVGVRLEQSIPGHVEVVIEDNGQGLAAAQREHLFDPFFSGRTAGRGRGLGLPIAWRLAREQGGDVRFEELTQGPTRFVLSLPGEPGTNGIGGHH